MKRQNRTTTTTVKNPNWPEANQLAIYKCSWEVEPGSTWIKFNEWLERFLNPGSPDLKASALTTGPHCKVTLFNVGSSFSYEPGINGSQQCALYPRPSVSAPFYSHLKKETFKSSRIKPGSSRSESRTLAN